MLEVMDNTSYGKAARVKFGAVPEDFHIFEASWVGKRVEDWKSMRVKGAQFKGNRRVPGTTMVTIVTRDEMAANK
jgi:hypothetical protein